jgi:hypothetical protein
MTETETRWKEGGRWEEPFANVLERVMHSRGVENVEELYQRYTEAGYGYIPVPGRHRDKKVKLPEFREHAAGRYPVIYGQFLTPVMDVLGVDFDGEEARALILAYMFGRNPRGE